MLGNNLLDVATPEKTNFEDFEGKKRVMHSTPMAQESAGVYRCYCGQVISSE